MEKTTLSEAEVKVLMYMKDQKPHRESPQGMDADVFGVVCEMLEERNFVKRIKENGPSFELYEPRIYHITAKGSDFIKALEQEMKWKREDFITDQELDMLFYQVLMKHPYFRNHSLGATFWNSTTERLKDLCTSENPLIRIKDIVQRFKEDDSNKDPDNKWLDEGYVDNGDRHAYKLYIILYYKYHTHPIYNIIPKALEKELGHLRDKGELENTNKHLDALIKENGVEYKCSTEDLETVRKQLAEASTLLDNANAKIKQLETENKELKDRLEESDSDTSNETETVEIPRQRIRIAMLNLLFEKVGCDTKWMTENRKVSAVARVYAAIMGVNNTKRIKDDVGTVTYAKRPPELDDELTDVNKLLRDINNEWKIDL